MQLLSSIDYTPSVIALTETWLGEEDEFLTCLPNYSFISLPRKSQRGGGVGFYVLNGLVYVIRKSMSISSDVIETITIDIVHTVSNILITCIYRPHATNVDIFNLQLDTLLHTIKAKRNISMVLGDFNIDLLKIHSHTPTTDFYNTIVAHGLTPTITKPTRITEFSATLLDNILINTIKYKCKATIFWSDISDHCPVMLQLADMKEFLPQPDCRHRVYNTSSITQFSYFLQEINWVDFNNRCSIEKDTNVLYQDFFLIFKKIYDRSFPVKIIKQTKAEIKSPPWMTYQLIKCCKKKSILFRVYKTTQTSANKNKFVAYRNKLKRTIKAAEKLYYSRIFEENLNNIKKTWQIINNILSSTKKTFKHIVLTDDNGNMYDDIQASNKFNEYFSNVGPTLAAKIGSSTNTFEHYLPKCIHSSAVFDFTYPQEIEFIIQQLKSSNAVGEDDIVVKVVKAVAPIIATPLSHLVNNSIETGIFPCALKISKVIPIFKTGDQGLLSNYRPISILPIFSKVFERVIFLRLKAYLLKLEIPSKNQYGFQQNVSTYMAIVNVIDDITESIDKKLYSIGVFIDLAKAFDTVNHSILLQKLSNYGIRGLPYSLIKNYLTNRKQFVSINGTFSSILPITCGVPQGSILGPLLFLIYIDYINQCSKLLKFVLFADDTNVFMSSPNFFTLIESLNKELTLLSDWFKSNKLSLNLAKTTYLIFGKRKINANYNPNLSVILDGAYISLATSAKFLGITIDSQLNWKFHINKLILKLNRNSAVISKIRHKINATVALKLYDTLINSHISYCAIVWAAGSNTTKLHKLHPIQKRTLHSVVQAHHRASSKPIFFNLKRLTIFDIYKSQVGSFMFANMHGQTPSTLPNISKTNLDFHSRLTRSSSLLHIPFARTNIRQSSLTIYAPRLWNTIPLYIKETISSIIFKKRLKKWLLSAYT